jgi:hypothetical protein
MLMCSLNRMKKNMKRAQRKVDSRSPNMFRERDGNVLHAPKSNGNSGTWASLLGCVPYRGPRKSIREMDEAVAALLRKENLPSTGLSAKR